MSYVCNLQVRMYKKEDNFFRKHSPDLFATIEDFTFPNQINIGESLILYPQSADIDGQLTLTVFELIHQFSKYNPKSLFTFQSTGNQLISK